jgi:hypothetical protein
MDNDERSVVQWARAEVAAGEARLYEHLASTFRWLMATLFAANGGGMIGLLDAGAHDLPGRRYALVWFAIGLVCSLFMGALSAVASFRANAAMVKMRVKLDEGLITGQSPSEALLEFVQSQKPNWKTWFPSYAGGASLLFFIIGLGTIAGSLALSG